MTANAPSNKFATSAINLLKDLVISKRRERDNVRYTIKEQSIQYQKKIEKKNDNNKKNNNDNNHDTITITDNEYDNKHNIT